MKNGRAFGAAMLWIFVLKPYEIMGSMLDQSVAVNGLFVPGGALESFLGRFVTNLAVWNHDEIFKVSITGSATPLIYKGHYFLGHLDF